jgi:DUF4097 and DUF4098 domain-containing protein YvlB
MKQHLLVLAGLLMVYFGSSCIEDPLDNVDNTRFTASESFSHEMTVTSQTNLQLVAIDGDIDIVSVSGSAAVRVFGEKKVSSESFADARDHLEDLQVFIDKTDNQIIVRTEQPGKSRGRQYTVHYQIHVPVVWTIDVHSINGTINLDGISGNIAVYLINGTVLARNLAGSATVEVTNGAIDLRMVLPAKGVANLSTVNGDIDFSVQRQVSAQFSASVINGRVIMNNLDLRNSISTRTSLQGILGDGQGQITLKAVNGAITAQGN